MGSKKIINNAFERKTTEHLNIDALVDGILASDTVSLSRGITLLESTKPAHEDLAGSLVEKCLSASGNSIRIGITGVPGVGKSTFIESLGKHLTGLGKRVAVLAIDPSSEKNGGSILGDKTRMETLVGRNDIFVRPSPSKGFLGGVASTTRESILLCEAAGFDVILIETVGVGQSETAVKNMVDFFLLLMLSGAGDELQGIKRGIMEMADAVVITKADGNNLGPAKNAMNEYRRALHLLPPNTSNWIPKVLTCSALENKNIDAIWKTITQHEIQTLQNGFKAHNRMNQSKYWLHERINDLLRKRFYGNEDVQLKLEATEQKVLEGKISAYGAAMELLRALNI